eukprot:4912171-Alexandrium_andersonii.AAC.1
MASPSPSWPARRAVDPTSLQRSVPWALRLVSSSGPCPGSATCLLSCPFARMQKREPSWGRPSRWRPMGLQPSRSLSSLKRTRVRRFLLAR